MLLTKDGKLHEDGWRHLDDDVAAGDGEPVTVSLARWQRDRAVLVTRNAPVGLRLPNDAAVETIAEDLGFLRLIVLDFPRFTDGRAYSQARLLRGRLGYANELRAAGNVLRDQLLFMQRCGIDSFAVGERAIVENWASAFRDFDIFHQKAEDTRPWIMQLRHAAP